MKEDHCASEQAADKEQKSRVVKIAGILSTAMWVVSFILLCVLKEGNPYVWISDFLLLAGFVPLLWVWKAGWPWLVFGILNMGIGFFLAVSAHLVVPPDVAPPEFFITQKHMKEMHPFMTWILMGMVSTAFGLFRVTSTIVRWIIEKRRTVRSEND